MSWFKTPFVVCLQNFRKWKGDYRVWTILIFIIVLNGEVISNLTPFLKENSIGVAPWIFAFYSSSPVLNAMMFLPLLVLFCDAPFIDANQPYVISRCSRRAWCMGQIIYIFAASAVYFLAIIAVSMIMLIGKMDLTLDWGAALNTLAADGSVYVLLRPEWKILFYFTPFTAMLYSFLLCWLAGTFLGLVAYAVNAFSGKSGYGVLTSGMFMFFNFLAIGCLNGRASYQTIVNFSPISWSSLYIIDIENNMPTPNITYIISGFAVLIIALSAAAMAASRKQEIKVIQSV